MNEEMISYIVLGIIISVIVNIIFLKVKNLIDIWRDRDSGSYETHSFTNPYNITENSYTHNPPPIPVPVNTSTQVNTQPQRDNNQVSNRRSNGRPPIPPRREGVRRTPDTYPKCPRCGCKNKRGQRQLVAWDNTNNKWRCYNGHLFCS